MDTKNIIILLLIILLVGAVAVAGYGLGLAQNNNDALSNNTTVNSTVSNNTNSGGGDVTYHYETVGPDTFLVDSNGIIHGGQADGCSISYMRQQYQEYLNDPEHYMA